MSNSELTESTKDPRGRSESDSRRSAATVEQSLVTTAGYPNPRVVRIGGVDNSAGSSRVPSPDVGGAGTVLGGTSSRPSTPLDLRGPGPSISKQDHFSSTTAPTLVPAPVVITPAGKRKAEARSSSRSRRPEENPQWEFELRLSFIEDTIEELRNKFAKGEARKRELGNIFHPTSEALVDTADIGEHKPLIKTPTRGIKKSSMENMISVHDGVGVSRDDKRDDTRSVPSHQSTHPSSPTEPSEQTSASIYEGEPSVDNTCRPAVEEGKQDVGALLLPCEDQTTVRDKSSLAMSSELRKSLDFDSGSAVEHAREASESYIASPAITPRPAVGTAVTVKSFITNLWQSSSGLEIQYPFPTPLHYRGLEELLIPVTVCRDQPASTIAHALASLAYHNSLREKLILSQQYVRQEFLAATAQGNHRGPSVSSPLPPTLHPPPDTHITLKWQDHGTFTCKIFFSAEFHLLRRLLLQPGGDEAFIRSLSASADWATKGGRSKSAFCKTLDDRFVLKEMRSTEQEPIDQFCPAYFDYITRAHNRHEPSTLARIFGIFSVGYSKSSRSSSSSATVVTSTSGQQASAAPRPLTHAGGKVFMVMENLFYGHKVDKIYDLKGNTSNRTTKEGPNVAPGEVFLDCNLLFHRVNTPLLVNPRASYVLPRAIDPDCAFLHLLHIMDYSLLVGLTDGPEPTVIVGIIDYIRKFTHDKFLENLVKETVLRTEDPTIVSPSQYMNRFTRTIPLYFDMVPDAWTGLDLVEPRKRFAAKKGLKPGGPVGSSRITLPDQPAAGRDVIRFQGGTTSSATNHPVC